jgi:hypothetical protein
VEVKIRWSKFHYFFVEFKKVFNIIPRHAFGSTTEGHMLSIYACFLSYYSIIVSPLTTLYEKVLGKVGVARILFIIFTILLTLNNVVPCLSLFLS